MQFVLAIAAVVKRVQMAEGWEFFPTIVHEPGELRSHKHDYTLFSSSIPKGYDIVQKAWDGTPKLLISEVDWMDLAGVAIYAIFIHFGKYKLIFVNKCNGLAFKRRSQTLSVTTNKIHKSRNSRLMVLSLSGIFYSGTGDKEYTNHPHQWGQNAQMPKGATDIDAIFSFLFQYF